MAMSSIFDGTGSIDSILLGIGLGLWIAFFCHNVIREPLDNHITLLMNGEYTISGYWPLLRATALISVIDFLIVLIIYYSLREDIKTAHPTWANII